MLSRFEERDEDVNINAPILTPKAHKRHMEERGLVGGILRPLTGILAAIDIPTPQESGLEEIPGEDPDHQYKEPGPTDVRGDCPTLNALANHGYISRNGVTSFAQAANAIQIGYSMSYDIAVFLSALGLLAGGDIPTGLYTIGGRDSRVPETLGTPVEGIDRHGFFEIDASINRGDRYFGDNHSFNITRWNRLVDQANEIGNGLFNTDVMKVNAAKSVEESVSVGLFPTRRCSPWGTNNVLTQNPPSSAISTRSSQWEQTSVSSTQLAHYLLDRFPMALR